MNLSCILYGSSDFLCLYFTAEEKHMLIKLALWRRCMLLQRVYGAYHRMGTYLNKQCMHTSD